MKHHLCNIQNVTHMLMNEGMMLSSCNASAKCKLNTGVLQPQCRLNNAIREVIKKEV
jgi:hypothetical protein